MSDKPKQVGWYLCQTTCDDGVRDIVLWRSSEGLRTAPSSQFLTSMAVLHSSGPLVLRSDVLAEVEAKIPATAKSVVGDSTKVIDIALTEDILRWHLLGDEAKGQDNEQPVVDFPVRTDDASDVANNLGGYRGDNRSLGDKKAVRLTKAERDEMPCEAEIRARQANGIYKSEDVIERCDRCGWPLRDDPKDGCVKGNCSQRPLPPKKEAEQDMLATIIFYGFDSGCKWDDVSQETRDLYKKIAAAVEVAVKKRMPWKTGILDECDKLREENAKLKAEAETTRREADCYRTQFERDYNEDDVSRWMTAATRVTELEAEISRLQAESGELRDAIEDSESERQLIESELASLKSPPVADRPTGRGVWWNEEDGYSIYYNDDTAACARPGRWIKIEKPAFPPVADPVEQKAKEIGREILFNTDRPIQDVIREQLAGWGPK